MTKEHEVVTQTFPGLITTGILSSLTMVPTAIVIGLIASCIKDINIMGRYSCLRESKKGLYADLS